MKAKMMAVGVLLCFAGAAMCLAQDPNMGTWKLNDAKSKFSTGSPKNNMVVYEAAGDSVKVTIDGTSGAGKPIHAEWTGKFDGQDYPVTGDPASDARAYTKVDGNTMTFSLKKGGKEIISGRIVIAADGKTRTVTSAGTDAMGKKIRATSVYDKQ